MSASAVAAAPKDEFTQTMNTVPEEGQSTRKRESDEPKENPVAKRFASISVSTGFKPFVGVRISGVKARAKGDGMTVSLQGSKLLEKYKFTFPGARIVASTEKPNSSGGAAWTILLKFKPAEKYSIGGLTADYGIPMGEIADSIRKDLIEWLGFTNLDGITGEDLYNAMQKKYGEALGATFLEMFVLYLAQGAGQSAIDPVGGFEVSQPSANAKGEDAIRAEHGRITKMYLKEGAATRTIYAYQLPEQPASNLPGQMLVRVNERSTTTVTIDSVLMHPESVRFYTDKFSTPRAEFTWRVEEIHAHTEA